MSDKVLLVSPASDVTQVLTPDLGIGFVAASLRNAGYHPEYLDMKLKGTSPAELAEKVQQSNYAAVGMKVFSPFLPDVNRAIAAIKDARPELPVILGGPHPTYAYKEALTTCPRADIAIHGEAEETMVRVMESIRTGGTLEGVPSVTFRSNDEVKTNPMRTGFPKLDGLPLPAWDIMDPREYREHENFWYFRKGKTVANISISRGCPFKCTFCSDFMNYGHKVRYRPVEKVIEEIKTLQGTYGVDELHVTDSILTVNKKYVYNLCNELERQNIRIPWATIDGTRLDTLDAELLRTMEQAGCYGTSVGIESGNDRILKFMQKGITKQKIEEKIHLIKDNTGFLIQGLFIIGFPTETGETMQETIDFARRLPIDMAAFSPFRITPGTAIAKYIEENEPEATPDWEAQTMERISYSPRGMTLDDVEEMMRRAYRGFYLRPHIAWKYLKFAATKSELRRILLSKVKTRVFGKRGSTGGTPSPQTSGAQG